MKDAISISADGLGYSIDLPGLRLAGCRVSAQTDGKTAVASNLGLSSEGGRAIISGETPFGPVSVRFSPAADGTSVTMVATLDLNVSARHVALFPLSGLEIAGATHLLSHGRSMGGCKTCKLPAKRLENEAGEEPGAKFESVFQTMVSFPNVKLHVTQDLRQDNLTFVTGFVDGDAIHDFSVSTHFEFAKPGRFTSEPTTLATVTDGFQAMRAWGDAQQSAPLPAEPQPVGWNSWDYYRWTITEDEVLKNADFIASDPVLSKHVKRIIVDDGWQYCYGEWEPNPFFKSGMDSLARNLRKMGFVPGLWICPGIAEPHSMIAQWQTDWLAMSEGGDPCLSFDCMRRKGFIIDPTLPAVKKWLFDLFTRYADMGYGYFKTDFLMPVTKAPRYHRELPRGQIIRELMTPITDAIRGKADLLGCGYDYNGGCDLVRMVRAGSDIHATWKGAKNNAVAVASRFWASNRVWVTDPDFCVCRGPETADDPDLGRLRCLYVFVTPEDTRSGLTPDLPWGFGFDTIRASEAECLLSIALMNGGAINLSDKLYVLNDRGLDLVRRTVSAARGSSPTPLDLFESDRASKWVQTIPGGLRVLLVNWADGGADLSLDLAPFGVNATSGRNFWTDANVPITDNVLRASLPAHSCLLVEIL
jgi:hypothetical protein